jgi:small-conductance mechanosensitive channel
MESSTALVLTARDRSWVRFWVNLGYRSLPMPIAMLSLFIAVDAGAGYLIAGIVLTAIIIGFPVVRFRRRRAAGEPDPEELRSARYRTWSRVVDLFVLASAVFLFITALTIAARE